MTDDPILEDDEPVATVAYTTVPAVGPPPPVWDDGAEEWVEQPSVVEVDPGTPAGPGIEDRVAAVEDAVDTLILDALGGDV